MAVAQLLDFEIDFARNPISESAAGFFVIILKFIFTAIFETKNHVKKFFFSEPDRDEKSVSVSNLEVTDNNFIKLILNSVNSRSEGNLQIKSC